MKNKSLFKKILQNTQKPQGFFRKNDVIRHEPWSCTAC